MMKLKIKPFIRKIKLLIKTQIPWLLPFSPSSIVPSFRLKPTDWSKQNVISIKTKACLNLDRPIEDRDRKLTFSSRRFWDRSGPVSRRSGNLSMEKSITSGWENLRSRRQESSLSMNLALTKITTRDINKAFTTWSGTQMSRLKNFLEKHLAKNLTSRTFKASSEMKLLSLFGLAQSPIYQEFALNLLSVSKDQINLKIFWNLLKVTTKDKSSSIFKKSQMMISCQSELGYRWNPEELVEKRHV